MSKRYVDDNFWVDSWVDELSFAEKSFFLYLLTNSYTNIAGVYEVPIKKIRTDTELDNETILAMFEKMKSKVRYINGWVIMRNAIKHQNYKNSKIKTGIEKILLKIPEDSFEFMDLPEDFAGGFVLKNDDQANLFDDSSMTNDDSLKSHLSTKKGKTMSHHESYMTLEEYKLNIIKLNKIKSNADESAEGSKDLSKTEKRNYARGVRADEAQADRAKSARARPATQPSGFNSQERKYR